MEEENTKALRATVRNDKEVDDIPDIFPAPVAVGTHLKFPTLALRFLVNSLMICIPYEVQARNLHILEHACVEDTSLTVTSSLVSSKWPTVDTNCRLSSYTRWVAFVNMDSTKGFQCS